MLPFKTLPHLLFALLLVLPFAESRTSTEWQSRTIYQILTDRFARSDNSTQPCPDLTDYCGGTFRGIMNNLDYIAGMGFDAIWISPIVENIDKGYHGYWAKDFYKLNPHFGTEDDLHALIDACHKRDIWVMVDVVANHIGPVGSNYSGITPFNDSSFYHEVCEITHFTNINMTEILNCRLSDLPDLAQENQNVRKFLLDWIKDLVQKYKIDGLRIDTVPYVPREFMAEFVKSAGVFSFGEVFLGNDSFIISYQEDVPGILNYPLYYAMKEVFISQGSMKKIQDYYKTIAPLWKNENLLGNFVDNHDNARFMSKTSNLAALKSALAFSLTSMGIPIVYQGDEQTFNGGDDPKNREPLWTSLNSSSEVYQLIAAINQLRKSEQFYKEAQIERDCDEKFYSFSRGQLFFAFTNSLEDQAREIKNHSYAEGTTLCNVLDPSRKDCAIVSQGTFDIDLLDGELKIFAPVLETQKKNFMAALFGGLFAITAFAGVFIKLCW